MKTLSYILFLLLLASCSGGSEKGTRAQTTITDPVYQNKLNAVKSHYPFAKWRESFKDGLLQYTPGNCNAAKAIFDDLISGLIAAGETASEKDKVQLFKTAILATNALNEACDGALIETGEREALCELTDKITIACGLDPEKYGAGEGLASEWREW